MPGPQAGKVENKRTLGHLLRVSTPSFGQNWGCRRLACELATPSQVKIRFTKATARLHSDNVRYALAFHLLDVE